MPAMSDTEYRGFITAGTRTAKWATTRRDGRPHVVPVWFVLEGDDLLITTGSKSVKGRAALRDPRVGLCVDDDRPPLRRGGGVRPAQCGRGDAAGADHPREGGVGEQHHW
jgi:hypothetical protein